MYLSSETKIWEAGTGGTGVTAPANRWFFGEGATGSFFDAWILLSNPGATDATVTSATSRTAAPTSPAPTPCRPAAASRSASSTKTRR